MLTDDYGYCKVPAGTKLFRSGELTEPIDCLFYSLQKNRAFVFGPLAKKIQVWKVLENFTVLFMIKGLNSASWASSAIIKIYNDKFDSSHLADIRANCIALKKPDNQDFSIRSSFICKLKEESLKGWLTSEEDRVDLEICLFPEKSEFHRIVKYENDVYRNDKQYDYDNALERIEIFPGKQFNVQSTKNMVHSPFKDYRRRIKSLIVEKKRNGFSEREAFLYYLDLRLKLEI